MNKKTIAKKATKKIAKKSTKKQQPPKIYGPDIYQRNKYGLLDNVDYIFNEDGSVDWRSMIKPEFLYPNKGWFDMRNQEMPSSIDGLKDNQLLIMLGGIKDLARLRGYSSVFFDVKHVSDDYVSAKCKINWISNYENMIWKDHEAEFRRPFEMCQSPTYEDVANATAENTDSFCIKFLETIACNRAFVRCVRNFLNIHIVGADEIDKSPSTPSKGSTSNGNNFIPITPSGLLEKNLVDKYGIDSFEGFKEILRELWKSEKYVNESVKDWKDFSDIPAKEARKLISILSK